MWLPVAFSFGIVLVQSGKYWGEAMGSVFSSSVTNAKGTPGVYVLVLLSVPSTRAETLLGLPHAHTNTHTHKGNPSW